MKRFCEPKYLLANSPRSWWNWPEVGNRKLSRVSYCKRVVSAEVMPSANRLEMRNCCGTVTSEPGENTPPTEPKLPKLTVTSSRL